RGARGDRRGGHAGPGAVRRGGVLLGPAPVGVVRGPVGRGVHGGPAAGAVREGDGVAPDRVGHAGPEPAVHAGGRGADAQRDRGGRVPPRRGPEGQAAGPQRAPPSQCLRGVVRQGGAGVVPQDRRAGGGDVVADGASRVLGPAQVQAATAADRTGRVLVIGGGAGCR